MDSWNARCAESIRKEKLEIEKTYGIKIGKTSISCARCGGAWGFGGHKCQGIYFKNLLVKGKKGVKSQTPLYSDDLTEISSPGTL